MEVANSLLGWELGGTLGLEIQICECMPTGDSSSSACPGTIGQR
jgi:hypothetical protein